MACNVFTYSLAYNFLEVEGIAIVGSVNRATAGMVIHLIFLTEVMLLLSSESMLACQPALLRQVCM